jgi:hypothetical protein
MSSIDSIVAAMRNAPQNVRFADLYRVCVSYFGEPRRAKGSHTVFKMPWQGDPRVNIQDDNGKAKRYQVLQVLEAIDRVENSK